MREVFVFMKYNLTTLKIYFKQGRKFKFLCQTGLKYSKIVFKYWKYILNTLKSVSKYIWFGKGKHRRDFKKAALTELKGEKGQICCLFWMLIVIGSETKKSLGWFLQFGWGPGVEVEVFMRRIKLLFGSTLLQLSSTTGLPTSNLAKRRTKFKSYKGFAETRL